MWREWKNFSRTLVEYSPPPSLSGEGGISPPPTPEKGRGGIFGVLPGPEGPLDVGINGNITQIVYTPPPLLQNKEYKM